MCLCGWDSWDPRHCGGCVQNWTGYGNVTKGRALTPPDSAGDELLIGPFPPQSPQGQGPPVPDQEAQSRAQPHWNILPLGEL